MDTKLWRIKLRISVILRRIELRVVELKRAKLRRAKL